MTRDKEDFDIYAVDDGIVCLVLTSSSPYGNRIYIQHDNLSGVIMYAHLDKMFVKPGSEVVAGQCIGKMGTTGFTLNTGKPTPHLHISYFSATAKEWTASYATDPTFIIQLGKYYPCNTKVSNPFKSKFFNPKSSVAYHEGIDFSGTQFIDNWKNIQIDPLFQDYMLKEDYPEKFV